MFFLDTLKKKQRGESKKKVGRVRKYSQRLKEREGQTDRGEVERERLKEKERMFSVKLR